MKTIVLTQGCTALVDDGDFNRINQFSWFAQVTKNTTYAARGGYLDGRHGTIGMHKEVLGVGRATIVDHVDGNGTNNTRANLRVATRHQNAGNSRKTTKKATTSRFKGVSLWKDRWYAFINGNYLGRFKSEVEAAHAYNEAAKRYWGEFAKLNEIPGGR